MVVVHCSNSRSHRRFMLHSKLDCWIYQRFWSCVVTCRLPCPLSLLLSSRTGRVRHWLFRWSGQGLLRHHQSSGCQTGCRSDPGSIEWVSLAVGLDYYEISHHRFRWQVHLLAHQTLFSRWWSARFGSMADHGNGAVSVNHHPDRAEGFDSILNHCCSEWQSCSSRYLSDLDQRSLAFAISS